MKNGEPDKKEEKRMKKRGYVIAAALTAGIMMAACGSSGQQTSGQQESTVQEDSQYTYDYNGTELKIDGELIAYTTKLGDPKGGYYEAKSCAFDGMDKFYYYDSVTLQGYQKNGIDRLYSITLTDDAVKTKEGIRVGDTKDKVKSVYGDAYTESDGQIKYDSGNTTLAFVMKDNEVQSIIYSLR